MKKAEYVEFIERYCFCPYCQSLQSDKENQDNIEAGIVIVCSDCGKKFKVDY